MDFVPPSTPLPLRPVLSRHELFRSHLSDVRHDFQTLLATITDENWRKPCKGTGWTVGETLVHVYLRLASIPAAINGIRMGTGYFTMPFFMRDYIQYWHIKTNAGKWSARNLGSAYDEAYWRAIEVLAEVGEEEWWASAEVWGEGGTTIAALFESYPDHFASHLYDIRVTMER